MDIRNGTNSINGNRWVLVLTTVLAPTLCGAMIGGVSAWNNRLTVHTEKIAVIEAQLKDTRDELGRINSKLDKLLERNK